MVDLLVLFSSKRKIKPPGILTAYRSLARSSVKRNPEQYRKHPENTDGGKTVSQKNRDRESRRGRREMQASTVWIFNEVVYWFIGVFMKQCFKGTDGVQPRMELLASIQLSIDSIDSTSYCRRSFVRTRFSSLSLACPSTLHNLFILLILYEKQINTYPMRISASTSLWGRRLY